MAGHPAHRTPGDPVSDHPGSVRWRTIHRGVGRGRDEHGRARIVRRRRSGSGGDRRGRRGDPPPDQGALRAQPLGAARSCPGAPAHARGICGRGEVARAVLRGAPGRAPSLCRGDRHLRGEVRAAARGGADRPPVSVQLRLRRPAGQRPRRVRAPWDRDPRHGDQPGRGGGPRRRRGRHDRRVGERGRGIGPRSSVRPPSRWPSARSFLRSPIGSAGR
jgi:hypothetical protein